MKIGILGGGQLGRMFLQVAANYPVQVKVLDPDAQAPCAHLCDEFVVGDFADEETVVAFGADCDAIGIEIEHVSVAGLKRLKAMGKRVVPDPDVLAMIQDKGLQKAFYVEHGIPTVPFYLAATSADVDTAHLPLVQKTRTGGYDGKGVQVIVSEEDVGKVWDVPSIVETFCQIDKEFAAIFVSDGRGDVRLYPLVEMVFDPILNLVDVVRMPAQLPPEVAQKARAICEKLAAAFAGAGVFAVEMFVSASGEVWVNETACRVHNSGHLTIEACVSSQFDQMMRVLAGWPLGDSRAFSAAAMVNLIGCEGQTGRPQLPGLQDMLARPGVSLHWYGKHEVRPGRKMGHITLRAPDSDVLHVTLETIRDNADLRVMAENHE